MGGTAPVQQLAAACGADSDALHLLLRHLAGRGVFLELPEEGVFRMNEAGRELLTDGAIAGMDLNGIGGRMARSWTTLLSAVRTGRPAYAECSGGLDFWSDLDANPEVRESFDALMGVAGHGRPDPDFLLDPTSWEQVRTVVDVGGGSGTLLAEVLAAHPGVGGVLVDLPSTVARSGPVFAAAAVDPARVRLCGQSFFEPLPTGGDLYLLKSVLADWPDAEAVAILRRCAEAARASSGNGGRVVILNGVTPDDERVYPDLLMLVLVGGKSRSLREFRVLAREAGLEVTASGRRPNGRFVVEAVAVPE
jgi:hypothetical protein